MTFPGAGGYDNVVDLLAATRSRDALAAADRARAPQPAKEPALFRIRVQLDDTPVWRLIDIRSDARLDVVHDVLQVTVGWTNSHLHNFRRGDDRYVMQYEIDEGDDGVPEHQVRLDDVLAEVGDVLSYQYDFGDGWDHTLTLEAVSPLTSAAVAVCVDGAKAGPPEDCGGVSGYEAAVAAVADREAADPDLVGWLGDWDPDAFDVAAANAGLERWATLPDGLASLADPTFGLPAAVADVVSRVRDPQIQWQLVELARAAALDEEPTVDASEAAEMVESYRWLLDRIGPKGLPTTASGYLKPADVLACATALGLARWIGKLNRENLTQPVLLLRQSAQKLGLIRKLHGEFVLTKTGAGLAQDPVALWKHLATRRPSTDRAANDARVIVLLLVSGGITPSSTAVHGPLVALGWGYSPTAPIREYDAYELARPTIGLLARVGALSDIWTTDPVVHSEAGVAFARTALRA